MPRSNRPKKLRVWRSSDGRKLLAKDLRDGTIPPDMPFDTAFFTRPEFCVYDPSLGHTEADALRLFESRIDAARERLAAKRTRAQEENEAMLQDRQIYPRPQYSSASGEPQWEGSEAQAWLKQDIAQGLQKTMSRMQFYNSRDAYKVFKQQTIVQHIYQEERLIKFINDPNRRKRYEVIDN